jgi:hypothetical protein
MEGVPPPSAHPFGQSDSSDEEYFEAVSPRISPPPDAITLSYSNETHPSSIARVDGTIFHDDDTRDALAYLIAIREARTPHGAYQDTTDAAIAYAKENYTPDMWNEATVGQGTPGLPPFEIHHTTLHVVRAASGDELYEHITSQKIFIDKDVLLNYVSRMRRGLEPSEGEGGGGEGESSSDESGSDSEESGPDHFIDAQGGEGENSSDELSTGWDSEDSGHDYFGGRSRTDQFYEADHNPERAAAIVRAEIRRVRHEGGGGGGGGGSVGPYDAALQAENIDEEIERLLETKKKLLENAETSKIYHERKQEEECSVCYELTLGKYKCGHRICEECRGMWKTKCDENGGRESCPICKTIQAKFCLLSM